MKRSNVGDAGMVNFETWMACVNFVMMASIKTLTTMTIPSLNGKLPAGNAQLDILLQKCWILIISKRCR
jgi:hypothetical protein